MNIHSGLIEHACLEQTASETVIRKKCEEAWIHQFKAICVPPAYVSYTREMLEFCPVKIEIATVIGFPFGYSTTATKIFEAKNALADGATELEVVMNLARFKSMAYLSIREELTQIAAIAHDHNALLKVCIEAGLLDLFELYTACEICAESGTDFVKTSTGMVTSGHDQAELIRKVHAILPGTVMIAAAGTLTSAAQAGEWVQAGASRIVTPSGVAMVSE